MLYERLAQAYEEIESTSGSLEKTKLFSELLNESNPEEIGYIIALTIGRLHPDWMELPELGIAEKVAIQVVSSAGSVSESSVIEVLRFTGDIGLTAESLLKGRGQMSLFPEEVSVIDVFNTLDDVSNASGSGSSREKISKLVGLIANTTPIEAKFILRTITGTLRLGLGSMGILDALSLAFLGNRESRSDIEKAFNVCSDLSQVAVILASEGIEAIRSIKAVVGTPIRMMAAKKLSNSTEILEKAGGTALVEYKYDGERVQVHKNGDKVTLFSRRQEVITYQYPDVVEYVQNFVKADICILEGECIAVDPETGRIRPFQELMRRRRKTGIEAMQEEVPVIVRFFDILHLDGRDVSNEPMLKRRELLESVIETSEKIAPTIGEVTNDPDRLDEIFAASLETGHEGVIAKAVHNESTYQAGSRSWLWIKLKASYKEGLTDSVDLVVVGAMYGRGKRTGVYGTILASAYDPVNDTFPTVCKIGTGFTDEALNEFKERLEGFQLEKMNPKVQSDVKADVWFEPIVVIEVLGDEITVSPVHHAGRGVIEDGGLAIRFPRFTGRWRDDKDPTQATTVSDLVDLFNNQTIRSQDT
ncbi:MAG: ATP-dependent DNA ligase [Candidatus Thorarchaeota archaeon]|nr:ATP-dependent DNA ligase [Candidatus Thorarchaeota archaeon]